MDRCHRKQMSIIKKIKELECPVFTNKSVNECITNLLRPSFEFYSILEWVFENLSLISVGELSKIGAIESKNLVVTMKLVYLGIINDTKINIFLEGRDAEISLSIWWLLVFLLNFKIEVIQSGEPVDDIAILTLKLYRWSYSRTSSSFKATIDNIFKISLGFFPQFLGNEFPKGMKSSSDLVCACTPDQSEEIQDYKEKIVFAFFPLSLCEELNIKDEELVHNTENNFDESSNDLVPIVPERYDLSHESLKQIWLNAEPELCKEFAILFVLLGDSEQFLKMRNSTSENSAAYEALQPMLEIFKSPVEEVSPFSESRLSKYINISEIKKTD